MSKRVQKVVPKLMAFSLSPQYFYRRGDHYWFCFTYPVTLRQHVGTSELRFSLQTTSKDHARYCASAIALKLKKVLKRMNNTQPLPHDHIKSLARNWLHDSIRDAERFYAELPTMDEDEWTERHDTLSELKDEAEEQTALNRTERYTRVADSILKSEGLTLAGADYQLLKRELAKAHADLMEAHLELLSGADASALKEADKQVQSSPAPVAGATPDAKLSPLLSEAVSKYVQEKEDAGRWTGRTVMQQEHGLRLMVQIVGDMPIDRLTRDKMRHYRKTVTKLPPNMKKQKACQGKTIDQILALGLPPMSEQTAKQSLERVSSFLKWAVREEYIAKNPADGIVIDTKAKSKNKRKPFDASDLQKLFGSDKYRQGGFSKSWYYWLPLMGLYTGARLGEMAQLRLEDVMQVDGVWLLNVVDDEGDTDGEDTADTSRTVKTAAGRRRIPVHSALIKLGFLDYVETVRRTGASQLFPSLKKGCAGWSDTPSKWFTRYRKEEGVTEKGKVFHSFRHSVISQLLQHSQFPLQHVQELIGHEQGEVAYSEYFHGLEAARLQELIETLQWPIDLEALAYNWKQCKP